MAANLNQRGDVSVYVLVVAVGTALSLFTVAAYLGARASSSSALANTARTLAEQVSLVCDLPATGSNICSYVAPEDGDLTRGGCEVYETGGETGWFCSWSDRTGQGGGVDSAPVQVADTVRTAGGGDLSVNRVYIAADMITQEVTASVSGCTSERWLPLVRWCGTATRTHHL